MGCCLGRDERTQNRTERRTSSSSTTSERTGLLSRYKNNNNCSNNISFLGDDSTSTSGVSGHSSVAGVDEFTYLEKNYSMETPSCLLPHINQLFKSICERYDIAVTNREKIDEALQLFKKVLEVDKHLSMSKCFSSWKSSLTEPKFTVSRYEETGAVKKISVRAEEVPRLRRKAQKHIRDLLDACHLFLQQKDFLKKEIVSGLEELDELMRDIPGLCKGVNLSSTERKNMPRIMKRAREQFAQFPNTIDRFSSQVSSLLQEINNSIHVLVDN